MAVTLRLARRGTRHRPFYHIVATDSRSARDGGFLEQLGVFDPLGAQQLAVDAEKTQKWLGVGAEVSSTVKRLLKRAGVTRPVAPAV